MSYDYTSELAPNTYYDRHFHSEAVKILPGEYYVTQRDLLIAPVRDRWNREPEKRERFMEYAKRWKAMPQPQRERARHGMQRWEGMTPEQRDQARALFHATRGLDKDARNDFMAKWRQMTQQQRADWTKAHPAPERRDNN